MCVVASGSLSADEGIQMHLNTPTNQELSHRRCLYYACPHSPLEKHALTSAVSVEEPKTKGLNVGLISHVQRLNEPLKFLRSYCLCETVSKHVRCWDERHLDHTTRYQVSDVMVAYSNMFGLFAELSLLGHANCGLVIAVHDSRFGGCGAVDIQLLQ